MTEFELVDLNDQLDHHPDNSDPLVSRSNEPLDPGSDEGAGGSGKDGCYAWVVCLSSFMIQALVVGILHAYGVLYVEFIREFGSNSAEAGTASL